MPELVLLTHATEFERPTNTGRLVLQTAQSSCPNEAQTAGNGWLVRAPLWQRRCPDAALIASIEAAADNPRQHYVLLYPSPDALIVDVDLPHSSTSATPDFPAGFILLDATWQQAQKMYNQSPYLHALPKWQIQSTHASAYKLRRNQKQQGWCTAELVQLLWRYSGASESAAELGRRFFDFNQR
ncbi:tRNA-uridine aminocarboxypropyltransferase [Rheinheimera texasensis]|uniref:tRNA-uridine aminocarboxypropyltransferase n=1 Tax=Rheinheimera texasensis TaxID=306205 RepID=UPI0004E19E78|nr:tRNA-uridine aminocarboxypropyltransferase [Rheinheimera texasensis]